jgi:PTH2 family peptidyl-tRNA hydrolase
MSQEKDYVMYIVVNDDLKMGKGKIASQVGHCVQHMVENIIRSYYESKKSDAYNRYMKWKNGAKKIVLKASKDELIKLCLHMESNPIYDAGKTQIESGSLTVVGFYPSCTNFNIFSQFKLL